MKSSYRRISIILVCVLLAVLCAHAANPFRMLQSATTLKVIDLTIDSNTVLTPFSGISKIYGLSVDATIIQPEEDSFVRVIIEDTDGKEYLVLESSHRFNDVDTVTLSTYCEETNYLSAVTPQRLRVVTNNAAIHLENLHIRLIPLPRTAAPSKEKLRQIRVEQVEEKVRQINTYNQSHGLLWAADTTTLSLMSYSERRQALGATDDYVEDGFAYYANGIFSSSVPQTLSTPTSSNFVKEFSWTNRHGKNWMTPVKSQGGSQMCVFFSTASVIEALVNLYHNKLINISVSAPELSYYSREDEIADGYREAYSRTSFPARPAPYVVERGVSRDLFFPFIDDKSAYSEIPAYANRTDSIKLASWNSIVSYPEVNQFLPHTLQDSVKTMLIKYGPMVSGLCALNQEDNKFQHAMTLVGFKTLQVGDTVKFAQRDSIMNDVVLSNDSPYIGHTAWLFKDSYFHTDPNYVMGGNGYGWVIFFGDYTMANPIYYKTPMYNWDYDDIVCTDDDGEGYYFWGIGVKPDYLPSWIPDQPDGDDSDADCGPMDAYGRLLDLTTRPPLPPVLLTNDETWSIPLTINRDICVSDATLTISSDVVYTDSKQLILSSGATLIIDGGTLENVTLEAQQGSSIMLLHHGKIISHHDHPFKIPLGVHLKIYSGMIQ